MLRMVYIICFSYPPYILEMCNRDRFSQKLISVIFINFTTFRKAAAEPDVVAHSFTACRSSSLLTTSDQRVYTLFSVEGFFVLPHVRVESSIERKLGEDVQSFSGRSSFTVVDISYRVGNGVPRHRSRPPPYNVTYITLSPVITLPTYVHPIE